MNHHPDIFAAPEKFDPDRWYVFVLLLRTFLVSCTLAELELLHSKFVSSRKQKCETLTIPLHLDKLLLFLAQSLERRNH